MGVAPDGADAWMWQDVFAKDVSVGAPPDLFNSNGQDWGLPPFVPHKLRAAWYEPFIQTVRTALRYARGLRIDHVMGLFRLFWIPVGEPRVRMGLMGGSLSTRTKCFRSWRWKASARSQDVYCRGRFRNRGRRCARETCGVRGALLPAAVVRGKAAGALSEAGGRGGVHARFADNRGNMVGS